MGRRKILLVLAALIAAMGTALVFLYVQGADGRAKKDYESVKVLKVVKHVDFGESFSDSAREGKFQLVDVPKDEVLEGAQTSLTGLTGKVANTALYPGEQVIAEKWAGEVDISTTVLAIPKGMMAISVELTDPARVAGFVNPGSEVAVFVNGTNETTDESFSRMLLKRVKVLGVGDTSTITSTKKTDDGEQTTEQVPRTIMTLAVSQKDAERVLYGATNGELAFGLLTKDSKLGKSASVTETTLFQ